MLNTDAKNRLISSQSSGTVSPLTSQYSRRSSRTPECRCQGHGIRHTHHELFQTDGKSHNVPALGWFQVNSQYSLHRSVHQPSTCESMYPSTQQAPMRFRSCNYSSFRKGRSKRPAHSHPDLLAVHLHIRARRWKKQGPRQNLVPCVELNEKSLWFHGLTSSISSSTELRFYAVEGKDHFTFHVQRTARGATSGVCLPKRSTDTPPPALPQQARSSRQRRLPH